MKTSPVTLLPVVFLGLVLSFIVAVLWRGEKPEVLTSALVGRAVPAFSLPSLDEEGKIFSNEDLRSHVAVINFFASWCVPCAAEQPVLAELAAATGVPVYGIAYKDKPADVAAFLAARGNPFSAVALDADGAAAIEWGVYGVPETFVVGADGTVLYRHVGPLTRAEAAALPLDEKGAR